MEPGAIGTLTEWQNLYPRREIMVLGLGLKGEEPINKGCCVRFEKGE